jgi:hypothetical protein
MSEKPQYPKNFKMLGMNMIEFGKKFLTEGMTEEDMRFQLDSFDLIYKQLRSNLRQALNRSFRTTAQDVQSKKRGRPSKTSS